MTVQSGFATPQLALDDNGQVSMKYPLYNCHFNMKDVEEITTVDVLPRARQGERCGNG
jgi:hypothetical protein